MKRGTSFLPGDGGSSGKSGGIKCNIVLLDGREVQQEIKKKTPGQWIFDHVSSKLGITERKYFGLLFEDEQKVQQWLEMSKPVKKQIKKGVAKVFYCIRLYPTDPLSTNESTRIQLYWQLKRDFTSGRLPCLTDTSLKIVSLMAQVEIGDWSSDNTVDYKTRLNLMRDEFAEQQNEISSRHQYLRGMQEIEARAQFLKLVSLLDFYGMVFYDVKYEDKVPYMLGMSPLGVALCKKMKIVQSYNWSRIIQVLYRGRRFIVRVTGDWVGKNKYQQLSFEVDSSKTCKDLYTTFVEHINFYTKESGGTKKKSQTESPTTPVTADADPVDLFANRIPLSSSNEDLRKQLLSDGRKAAEERLHRSLSLPRRTKNQIQPRVDVQSLFPPPPTNTTTSDPILDALKSRLRAQSVTTAPNHDPEPDSHTNTEGTGMDSSLANRTSVFMDTQSVSSHDPVHDSLLDLADDLGNNEDEEEDEELIISELESSPGRRRHRSSSLPHIAEFSVTTNPTTLLPSKNDSSPMIADPTRTRGHGKRIQSVSEEKLQNRQLVLSWVKEQKRKDRAKASPTTNPRSALPTIKKTSSGGEPSKSHTYFVKTKWSPTSDRPSSSFLPRVTLTGGSPHPYDIYDVPRPSPVPSPFNVKRTTTQSSASAHSSLHSVITESTYDVPRSLIDLRQVDSPYPVQSVMSSTTTKPSSYCNSRLSMSSNEPIDQLTMLKDAYPDYDIPKPIENPDYDVPRSLRSQGTRSTSDSKSEGNLSFGDLDKMMADIDTDVAIAIEDRVFKGEESPKEEGPRIGEKTENTSLQEESKQKDEGRSPSENEEVDGVVVPESSNQIDPIRRSSDVVGDDGGHESRSALRQLHHQPASYPQVVPPPPPLSNYDRLSARLALEQLKRDGIVPQDVVEKSKAAVDENGMVQQQKENVTLAIDQTQRQQQLKLEELLQANQTSNNRTPQQSMPFDPQFFARQTALEQQQNHRPTQSQQQPTTNGRTGVSPYHSQQGSISNSQAESPVAASTTRSNESLPRPKIEPIYQEISDQSGSHHRSQHSWSGSSRNNVTAAVQGTLPTESSPGTRHKRTFSGGDLLSVKPLSRHNTTAGTAMSNGLGSSFDRLKWQTASMRVGGVVEASTDHTHHEESIPTSSKMPQADTMSLRSQQYTIGGGHHPQYFHEHLTNLETPSNTLQQGNGHNRVMNWMQQHQFSDPALMGQPHLPPSTTGYRPQHLPISQSVHSQLNRPLPIPTEHRGGSSFKDHLYEDLEEAAAKHFNRAGVMGPNSASSLPRMRAMTYSTNQISNSSLPYVTRELPSSKPGNTMYATDV